VHLRRALLLFALVLGLTALAASIAPAPKQPAPAGTTPAAAPAARPVEDASLYFRAPVRRRGGAPSRRVAPDAHVTVVVAAREPGQAEIPRLGLTEALTPSTPAEFDLVASDAGRYDVIFMPTDGRPAHVGTLVSGARR
jgi:hypothetical protein